MNHDEGQWKKEFENFSLVKKCPKCGKLSLIYQEGKIACSECGFEQVIGKVKK